MRPGAEEEEGEGSVGEDETSSSEDNPVKQRGDKQHAQ